MLDKIIQSILISSIFILLFILFNFAPDPQVSFNQDGNIYKRTLRGRLGIIGGATTENDTDFPFQLKLFKQGVFHCGASIIDHGIGITAAHCLAHDSDQLSRYEVVAGSTKALYILGPNTPDWQGYHEHQQRRQITRLQIHPEFNPRTLYNDIAVFSVDKNFTFNKRVKNIRIPQPDLEAPEDLIGLRATATGWGLIIELENIVPRILQKIELPIVRCDPFYGDGDDTLICAAEPFLSPCYGDSGGPLFINFPRASSLLIGLTSKGRNCTGTPPAQFTNVRFYTNWIYETMSQLTSG